MILFTKFIVYPKLCVVNVYYLLRNLKDLSDP
jgi:hypothetical protein